MNASYWEARFQGWATGPGTSEEDRIENAVTAIRKAMDADDKLAPITKVYVQGSYRNRVNVRQESDVDVAVLYTGGGFYDEYPEGLSRAGFGITEHPYTYKQSRVQIRSATLINELGGRDAIASEPLDRQVKVAWNELHTSHPRRTIPNCHSHQSRT